MATVLALLATPIFAAGIILTLRLNTMRQRPAMRVLVMTNACFYGGAILWGWSLLLVLMEVIL